MENLKRLAASYEWVEEISNKTIIELKKTADILEEMHNQFFIQYGISNTKFNVLVILNNAYAEGVMLSEIGDQMLVTKANITGLIDRLEKQGLVQRIRDDVDRRKIMAVITDKGRSFTLETIEKYKEWSKNLLTVLDDAEKNQLIHTLKKIQKRLTNFRNSEIINYR